MNANICRLYLNPYFTHDVDLQGEPNTTYDKEIFSVIYPWPV